MIEELRLRNFKSFGEAHVPFAPLTLLVGANASGKSNVFDAIKFLQGIGLGYSVEHALSGFLKGGRVVWPGIRGGAEEACRHASNELGITSTWRAAAGSFTHQISCKLKGRGSPCIVREKLGADGLGPYLFDTHAPTLGDSTGLQAGGAIRVGMKGVGSGRNPAATLGSNRSLLGQVVDQPGRIHSTVKEWAFYARSALQSSLFLDITPSRMRDYVSRSSTEIGAEGENISAVAWNLCQEPETQQDLLDWLEELCAPELSGIDFVETELGDVILQLVEEDGSRTSARSLSDGTLRFLGEITALLTAPKGSVVLMEEIENGLHPARIHLLVEFLVEITRTREVQVIATTHSTRVLSALEQVSKDLLGKCVVLGRHEGNDGQTEVSRFTDLPNFRETLDRRGIEYLFSTSWLERAL